MPIHDWTRVTTGIYHDFHATWIIALKRALNDGVLPPVRNDPPEARTQGS